MVDIYIYCMIFIYLSIYLGLGICAFKRHLLNPKALRSQRLGCVMIHIPSSQVCVSVGGGVILHRKEPLMVVGSPMRHVLTMAHWKVQSFQD